MEYKSERHYNFAKIHPSEDKPKRIAPAPVRRRPHFLGKISLTALSAPALILLTVIAIKACTLS